jgi:hypothetical protein
MLLEYVLPILVLRIEDESPFVGLLPGRSGGAKPGRTDYSSG